MGTQAVTTPIISDDTLKERALAIKNAKIALGEDYLTEPIVDKKTGAIFTFTKDPTTGEVKCTYKYHDEKPKDLLLFKTATVATSNARLASLNDAQLEEYKQNNPNSYLSTGYLCSEEIITELKRLEGLLNHYDDATRKDAIKKYEALVAEQLYLSASVDKKTAGKMAKFIRQDAQAGNKAGNTTVYLDKDEYNRAKKQLKKEQNVAEKEIEAAIERGFQANAYSLAKMEQEVQYIDDKDVRAYINSHQDTFFENGKFSSDKYHEWIKGHLRGDNTLTTGERKPASDATGLSEKDMKHAARDGNYQTQNDYTLLINSAKTIAAAAAPLVVAYMTNHNIHTVSELQSVIDVYAKNPDPSQYEEFISAISKADAVASVTANFRNVAVRNAFFGVLGPAIATLWNPENQRDKISDGRTAATTVYQNITRGTDVTDISGEVVIEEGCDDCDANIKRVSTEGKNTPEDVKYEPSYFKETKERSHWYDFVQAYDFDHKQYSIKDIYRAIQRRNGYSNEKPNPPANVMLPLELHDAQGNVIATRKAQYQIPKHPIPQGKGNGKGNAPGGTPKMSHTPGSNKWTVTDCSGKVIGNYSTEAAAKAKYKDITGKDFTGTIQ